MADIRWRPLRQLISGNWTTGNIQVVTVPVNINATTFAQALQAITTRRVNLENFAERRKRDIDAIQRLPGETDDRAAIGRVIAEDVTINWPTS